MCWGDKSTSSVLEKELQAHIRPAIFCGGGGGRGWGGDGSLKNNSIAFIHPKRLKCSNPELKNVQRLTRVKQKCYG